MKWLDQIPLFWLAPPAILLAISPLGQQPHLVQKLQMLFNGELNQAVDIFDLLMHGLPITLLVFYAYRRLVVRQRQG